MRRFEIRYSVNEKYDVPATVLLPRERKTDTAILALHQTTVPPTIGRREVMGEVGREDMHYGLELARRGFMVIAPDYPLFGDYIIDVERVYSDFGYASMTAKGIANHITAMNVLEAMAGVTRCNFITIGHSLGGSNSIFVGTQDSRVIASVSSAGFGSFQTYAELSNTKDLTGWARRDKYMPLIKTQFGLSARRLGFDFDEILACHNTGNFFLNIPVHDDVFPFKRQEEIIRNSKNLLAASTKEAIIDVEFPQTGHSFPAHARASAYSYINKMI